MLQQDAPKNNKKPRCHIPWQQMVVDSTGAVSPCSFWSGFGQDNGLIGNVNEQSINEIWNGEKYQKLRKAMAAGDLKSAGCENCFALKNNLDLDFQFDADSQKENESRYSQNIKLLKEEIQNGKTILEAKPTVLSFTPSHACNFRCTHCYQEDTRSSKVKSESIYNEVEALFPYLDQITAGGGEPFIQPFWQKMLEQYDQNVNPYITFATATNASKLTDKTVEGLRRFKKLNINISFDGGSKAVYEKVRVHGNYDSVLTNVDRFQTLVNEKNGSSIGFCLSVMKSNINDLENFVKLCAEKKLPFSFSPVTVMPPDESICCFNDIQNEVLGWKDSLEKAKKAVEEKFIPEFSKVHSTHNFWKDYVNVIENEIPWKWLEEEHYRVVIELDADLIEKNKKSLNKNDDVILYIFRKKYNWRGSAQYWGKIVNNRVEVSLPEGEFYFGFSNKWRNIEPDLSLRATLQRRYQNDLVCKSTKGVRFVELISNGLNFKSSRWIQQDLILKTKAFFLKNMGPSYRFLGKLYRKYIPREY